MESARRFLGESTFLLNCIEPLTHLENNCHLNHIESSFHGCAHHSCLILIQYCFICFTLFLLWSLGTLSVGSCVVLTYTSVCVHACMHTYIHVALSRESQSSPLWLMRIQMPPSSGSCLALSSQVLFVAWLCVVVPCACAVLFLAKT